MSNEKTVNYTDAQTLQLVQEYQAGATVEALANKLGKSARSVIAKLTREGVYKSKQRASGVARVTKAQVLRQLEDLMDLDQDSLQSMEKADMATLQLVLAWVTNRSN